MIDQGDDGMDLRESMTAFARLTGDPRAIVMSYAARAVDAVFDGGISTYEREEYEACAERLWLIAGELGAWN
ncbi:MAG: hypothetical protein M0Z82_03950 [Actinomycetota bacterium]|nr:hypothetical protein [Actinomycetota bacterium]